ncbi:putative speedy protein E7 [Erethizon dorsatum]
MATGEPSSQSEDWSPQPFSPGYALEVVIGDDEIQGQSGLWEEHSLLPQACVQKRKRDWSSGTEEELHEDLLGFADGDRGLSRYFMPQSPAQKRQKDYNISELESEAEKEKDHQGGSDSALSGNPNLPPRSSGSKWKREWSSELKEDEEGGWAWGFDLACREDMRLPPCKRWREYLSLLYEESQETWGYLNPVPSTHTGVTEKPCGLKKKRKMKHPSSVLPEHHAAFTRLLGKETPHSTSNLVVQEHKRLTVTSVTHIREDYYLLAMVIAYFSHAGLFSWQYQRIHFFLALHLTNDMEEDDELAKLDMFFFIYGRNLAQIPKFHKLRYDFICCMGWDLRVTREECEEVGGPLDLAGRAGLDCRQIQAYDPGLWVWKRDHTLIQGTLEA